MDPKEILEMVNQFYSSSFDRLFNLTILIIGFGGFILPFVLQVIQSMTLKKERDILRSQITDEVSKELSIKFESEKKQIKNEILKDVAYSRAGVLLIQSRIAFNNEEYASAVEDLCKAIILFIDSQDEAQIQRALNALVNQAIPSLSPKDFNTIFDIDASIEKLLARLAENNINSKYSDIIKIIAYAINKAKTTPGTPTTSLG